MNTYGKKKVQIFLIGELIPEDAKFLYSKVVCTRDEPDHNCICPAQINCNCRIVEKEERLYYEVPVQGVGCANVTTKKD